MGMAMIDDYPGGEKVLKNLLTAERAYVLAVVDYARFAFKTTHKLDDKTGARDFAFGIVEHLQCVVDASFNEDGS